MKHEASGRGRGLALVPLLLPPLLASCGAIADPPPAVASATPRRDARISLDELRSRQRSAASQSPIALGEAMAAPRACRDWLSGESVAIDRLPVDYWRAGIIYYLHTQGIDGAQAWCERWLARMFLPGRGDRGEDGWSDTPEGSLNHQLARYGGIYFCTKLLGPENAAAATRSEAGRTCVALSREILRDILHGRWRARCSPWSQHASAGREPEVTRSRHYAPRDWEYLWEIADMGDEPEASLAAAELDAAVEILRRGVRVDGLWDERLLPRFRAEKDDTAFRNAFTLFGLSCHPGQTPVLSYIVFPHLPWRPEFQGHYRPRGDDERILQWSGYILVGGSRWRPPRGQP